MLDVLFDLQPLPQFLAFCVFSALMLSVSFIWLQFLHRRWLTTPKLLPAGSVFTPVAAIFALFLTFLAVDIWAQQRQASDAAMKEQVAMQRLHDLASPAALNAPASLPLMTRYTEAVRDHEWGSDYNRHPSSVAAEALRDLRFYVVRLSAAGAPAVLVNEWLASVQSLEDARFRRLFIGADHTDNNQWASVLLLALFTHLIIAASHMDRPPAGRLVLVVFSLAATLALWQLAMHTNPYVGGITRIEMPFKVLAPMPGPVPAVSEPPPS